MWGRCSGKIFKWFRYILILISICDVSSYTNIYTKLFENNARVRMRRLMVARGWKNSFVTKILIE